MSTKYGFSTNDWRFKFKGVRGYKDSVGTTWESVGENDFTFYAQPCQLQVVSDNANDDASSGTGAQTIKVTGIDETWNQITIHSNLSGTTPVVLSPNMIRVNDLEVLTVGSSGLNEGIVMIGNSVDNVRWIPDDMNGTAPSRSYDCHATVPISHQAHITKLQLTSKNTSPLYVQLMGRDRSASNLPQKVLYQTIVDSSPSTITFDGFIVGEKNDIWLECKSTATLENVESYVEYVLEYMVN